jgi:hypothetical protein
MSWPQVFSILSRPPDSRPVRVVEQEILEELEFHVEMRTLDNVTAGMPADEARQDAIHRFGDFQRIHKACRQTLLGERIMLQRVQAILTLVLLGAVIFLGVEFYRGQRASEAATALMIQKSDAATARMMRSLEKLAEKPAGNYPDDLAPRVVQTTPRNGDRDVDPWLREIRVTFDKAMKDKSWSWLQLNGLSYPETYGHVRYEADHKTCVLPVKLSPDATYFIRLNSESVGNFQDLQGRSAVPYLLQFSTRSPISAAGLLRSEPSPQFEALEPSILDRLFPRDAKLTDVQREFRNWSEETFPALAAVWWQSLSPTENAAWEEKWLKQLSSGSEEKRMMAIRCLAGAGCKKAVSPVLKIAAERVEKDNADRCEAVRALGILGDRSLVPELVPLTYHYNMNTRLWAQVALVRLTGENFGRDVAAWKAWWEKQGGKPPVDEKPVVWATSPETLPYADPKKQDEMDRQFAK